MVVRIHESAVRTGDACERGDKADDELLLFAHVHEFEFSAFVVCVVQ